MGKHHTEQLHEPFVLTAMDPEKVDERIVRSEFLVINLDFAPKWFVREWFFHLHVG